MSWRLRSLIVAGVLALAAGAFAQTAEPPSPEVAPQVQVAAELVPTAQQGQPTPSAETPVVPEHAGPTGDETKYSEFGSRHAAEHAEGSGDAEHVTFSKKTFALQLLNFGVLLFILIYFGGGAMNKALRARHEQLKNDIGEAARLRDDAKGKFKAQDLRIADLEKEIAALRASLHKDAEGEQARLLEGAQEKAKHIQEELRFQLDQQVKEAELVLRAQVATASMQLAEELVRKSVTPDDQRRLAQEFVAGFGGPTTPGGES